MIVTGKVSGDEQVIKRLQSIPPSVHAKLLAAVTRLTIELQGYVVRNKLSGQVLKRVTGTLVRSIQPKVVNDANGIIGIVGSRSNESKALKYAAVHEYGFKGVVTVKSHLRMQTMAWGKSITPTQVTVKEHAMKMNIHERSFLRSSLAENADNIRAKIGKAIGEGIKP